MATFEVTAPDGQKFRVNAPEGATQQDAIKFIASQHYGVRESTGPGIAASIGEGALQGISFGFGDEIEGGIRALGAKLTGDSRPFGELYDEGVAKPRARIAAAKEAHPVAFGAGELGAGLAVPGGLARAGIAGPLALASGRGLGARSLAGAAEGAAYGGLYGAGTSEGGLDERLKGAAGGAVAGSVIGGAMPGAVDLTSAVGSRLAMPFRAMANPRGVAAEKLGEAINRDFQAGTSAVGQSERFGDRFGTMLEANPQARLMDAGGENVRNLMRAANNMPNSFREAARRTVDARQAGQYARITDDIHTAFGEQRNFYQTIDALTQDLDRIGSEAIQPALQRETPLTPELRRVLSRPTAMELQNSVNRKLQDEGLAIGLETRTQMLHRLKVELDDRIGIARRAEQMGNQPQAGMDVRTLTILKRDLLNAIDNPEYKAGLRQYAGEARLRSAAEQGFENFNTAAPEEIGAALRNLETDAERRMYRLGAMRAVVDRVYKGNVNRDRTDGIFSSPEIQVKLRAILPDQRSFREFQKQLVIEAKMADSRKALQGNSTTAKQLTEGAQAGAAANMISSVANAASGGLTPIMNAIAQGYNRFSGMTPGVAGQLLNMGMSRDPAAVNALVRRGVEEAAQTPIRRAQRAQSITAGLLPVMLSPSQNALAYPPR